MKTQSEIVKDGQGFAFMIEKLIDYNGSFSVTYRTWSIKNECGGFQTTVLVKDAPVSTYKFFVVAHRFEAKQFEGLLGAKITKFTTNNVVSDKFSFFNIKNLLTNDQQTL